MFNEPAIYDFIVDSGISREAKIIPLAGGRNNRLYRIGDYVLKLYFTHPGDTRDRLGHEYKFIKLIWNNGVKNVPRPFSVNYDLNAALFEYIDGRKLCQSGVENHHIGSVIKFVKKINLLRKLPEADELSEAADSAFSLSGHLNNIQKRVDSFKGFEPNSRVESDALEFIAESLFTAWEKGKKEFLERSKELNIDIERHLSTSEKCLSPSDFGFHNALVKEDGSVIFLDFEYAGWDDPVKLVADFFCQPEVPVRMEFFDEFVLALSELFSGENGSLMEKAKLFLPLNRLKWCFIILNDFLQVGNERRAFSKKNEAEERKKIQLDKAIKYFENH